MKTNEVKRMTDEQTAALWNEMNELKVGNEIATCLDPNAPMISFVRVEKETEKAFFFTNVYSGKSVWVPKSAILRIETNEKHKGCVGIRYCMKPWFQKRLIEAHKSYLISVFQ